MPVSSNCVYFSLFNRINRFFFRKRNSFVDTISGCVPQLFLQNSVGRNRGSKSVKASDTLFSLFSIYTFRTPVSVCLSLSVCVCVCVCSWWYLSPFPKVCAHWHFPLPISRMLHLPVYAQRVTEYAVILTSENRSFEANIHPTI